GAASPGQGDRVAGQPGGGVLMAGERHVVVVGGGILGLSTAWFLTQGGATVTVLEARTLASGSSFANGGWLCPAQAGPLPEPGLTLYGMRALFNRDSPLYFSTREWQQLAPWLLRVWAYCNPRDHPLGTPPLGPLLRPLFHPLHP